MKKIKTAVVLIGATGKVGELICEIFSSDSVLILGYKNNVTKANLLVNKLRKRGQAADAFAVDISDLESIKNFLSEIYKTYDVISALIISVTGNNVRRSFISIDSVEILNSSNLNFTYPILVVNEFSKKMVGDGVKRDKSIVLISSEAAYFGGNLLAVYSAAKAGLNLFVKSAAKDLGFCGIRLNAVSIRVSSEINDKNNLFVDATPLKRMPTVHEIAKPILWLCSEEASYVTGEILRVNGGEW